jgi:uracil-DNA glycosylase
MPFGLVWGAYDDEMEVVGGGILKSRSMVVGEFVSASDGKSISMLAGDGARQDYGATDVGGVLDGRCRLKTTDC